MSSIAVRQARRRRVKALTNNGRDDTRSSTRDSLTKAYGAFRRRPSLTPVAHDELRVPLTSAFGSRSPANGNFGEVNAKIQRSLGGTRVDTVAADLYLREESAP